MADGDESCLNPSPVLVIGTMSPMKLLCNCHNMNEHGDHWLNFMKKLSKYFYYWSMPLKTLTACALVGHFWDIWLWEYLKRNVVLHLTLE